MRSLVYLLELLITYFAEVVLSSSVDKFKHGQQFLELFSGALCKDGAILDEVDEEHSVDLFGVVVVGDVVFVIEHP